MRAIEWAAILGALAWLPHLFRFARDYFTKANVQIIVQRTPEVGFSTLGSILNLRMAIAVQNRDLVVSGIIIRLRHESGEEKIFAWQGIRQTFGTYNSPETGTVPFEKESEVLAIKLLETDIAERLIRFQDDSFILEKNEYEEKAVKKLLFLRDQESFEQDEFLKCEEMKDLYSFIRRSFSWKEGKYSATIEFIALEEFEFEGNQFEFKLSAIDIEELEKNKELIETAYLHLYAPPSDAEDSLGWRWRYPLMRMITTPDTDSK